MADIVITQAAAEKLIRARDGRAALYYIHLLSGGGAGAEACAEALGFSEAETLAAQAALSAAGLLPKTLIESEPQKPEYSPDDLTDKLEGDPAFAALVEYTQARISRTLSPADTAKLLEIYDHLGMPAGEIMLLVSYCMSREKRKKGEAARLGMWAVEREAYRWLREGIDTEDKAESYLRALERRDAAVENLARVLQIRGRELSASERKYLEKWAQSGLTDEQIYAAYDKTVLATGSLRWQYMDRIIEDWKENGAPAEGESRAPSAGRHPSTRRAASAAAEDEPSAAELLERRGKKEE